MQIHDVHVGRNRFCGPAALSAITGRPVDEIVDVLHALYPGKVVKGTHGFELRKALQQYGLNLIGGALEPRVTLAKWLRVNKALRTPGRVFLLASAHHWVVVSGRRIVCGKVKSVMSVRAYPHRRGWVAEVYEVHGTLKRGTPDVVKLLRSQKAAKVRAASKESAAKAKTRRLAERHGIDIDPDEYTRVIWVYPPDGLYASEADDPYDDDHCATYWEEVDERVRRYAEDASKVAAVLTGAEPPLVSGVA